METTAKQNLCNSRKRLVLSLSFCYNEEIKFHVLIYMMHTWTIIIKFAIQIRYFLEGRL